ncbi:EamA family transporter RarD [Micromonospora sp. NPDC023956]|uniref:EamA family transporter RarD n=1 Tax=Micromonospora sp. NPDC023956 TaxID=3155722 RepID=UPI0033FCBB40
MTQQTRLDADLPAPTTATGSDRRQSVGVLAGVGAYTLWGLLTLYWPLLEPAAAVEILAHRVVWSLVLVALVLTVLRDWRWVPSLWRDRRRLGMLMAAGCFVGANWGLYIWAVNSDHVIEASLGYYITPLFSTLLGLLLRERPTGVQWTAIGLVGVGVLWLAIDAGRPPWVALGLAVTFGFYGLLRKKAAMPTWRGLAVETATLAVPAAVYLAVLGSAGQGHFGGDAGHSLLLASTGLVTALPLALFGFAAVRTPLTVMGMLQFLLPTIQFVIGYVTLDEPVTLGAFGAYCLVWIGVVVFLTAYATAGRTARTGRPDPS